MSAGRTFGTIGTFRAPPRAVQSDIAAVELPEGPGLAYKMRFLLGHRSNQIDSDDLKLTGRQPTATAALAKSGTVGAYFYGVRSCGGGRRPRGLSAGAELRLSLTARGTRTAAGRVEKPRVVRGRDAGLRQGHATVRMRPGTTRIAAALPIRGVLVVAMALRCRLLRADICHSLCANPRPIHGELREERPSGRVILVNHGSKADSNSTRRATPAQQPLLPSIHVARQWTTATAVVVAYVALEWVREALINAAMRSFAA